MTQEEKHLLLKDLCSRLPYGVIVDYKENEFEIPHWKITNIYPDTFDGWIGYDKRVGAGSESGSRHFKIGQFKPYLRPLSSMTEEEKKEVSILLNYEFYVDDDYALVAEDDRHRISLDLLKIYIDWLNKKMFDYRGLIPKCLAIKVTKEKNPYEN